MKIENELLIQLNDIIRKNYESDDNIKIELKTILSDEDQIIINLKVNFASLGGAGSIQLFTRVMEVVKRNGYLYKYHFVSIEIDNFSILIYKGI